MGKLLLGSFEHVLINNNVFLKFWSPHLSFHAPIVTYFNFILNLNFWINTSQAILLWTWFKKKALVIHLSFDTLTITNFHFIPNLSYWINNAMNNIIMNSTPFFWYNHNHIIYISALNKTLESFDGEIFLHFTTIFVTWTFLYMFMDSFL